MGFEPISSVLETDILPIKLSPYILIKFWLRQNYERTELLFIAVGISNQRPTLIPLRFIRTVAINKQHLPLVPQQGFTPLDIIPLLLYSELASY